MGQDSYPIFVDLRDRPVLVVGAGEVAARKVRGLLECGARVTVVSRQFPPDFANLVGFSGNSPAVVAPSAGTSQPLKPAPSGLACHMGAFDRKMIGWADWRLVFAATNMPEVNQAVQAAARTAHILCCRSDENTESDFANAAVGRAGAVTVAVSTGGGSPGLAVRIRDQAVGAIDPVLAALAGLIGEWRGPVKSQIVEAEPRRKLLEQLSGEEMEACLRSGGESAARELFTRWIAEAAALPGDGHG